MARHYEVAFSPVLPGTAECLADTLSGAECWWLPWAAHAHQRWPSAACRAGPCWSWTSPAGLLSAQQQDKHWGAPHSETQKIWAEVAAVCGATEPISCAAIHSHKHTADDPADCGDQATQLGTGGHRLAQDMLPETWEQAAEFLLNGRLQLRRLLTRSARALGTAAAAASSAPRPRSCS